MTQPPYQPPPQFYYAAPVNPRPTSVTVMAIIGIVFAAMRLICTPMAVAPFLIHLPRSNPVMDVYRADAIMIPVLVAFALLGVVLALMLLAGSIGALTLKRWARKLLIAYGWAAIIIEVAAVAFQLAYVLPRITRALSGNSAAPSAIGGMIGGVSGALIALAIPILMIIFMTRPNVIAAFEGTAVAGPVPGYPPAPPGPYSM